MVARMLFLYGYYYYGAWVVSKASAERYVGRWVGSGDESAFGEVEFATTYPHTYLPLRQCFADHPSHIIIITI